MSRNKLHSGTISTISPSYPMQCCVTLSDLRGSLASLSKILQKYYINTTKRVTEIRSPFRSHINWVFLDWN